MLGFHRQWQLRASTMKHSNKADIWEFEQGVWRDTKPQTTDREMNTHRLLRNSLLSFELSQAILPRVYLGCHSVQLSKVKLVMETQMGVVVGLWFYFTASIRGFRKSHLGVFQVCFLSQIEPLNSNQDNSSTATATRKWTEDRNRRRETSSDNPATKHLWATRWCKCSPATLPQTVFKFPFSH